MISATFNWTGSDDVTPLANLVYAYRLDPIEAGFSTFGSATTKSYTNLSNGSYTFYVKAKDQAGNEDQTRFKPTASGAKTASLTIPSNDPDENPVNVSLSGTGTP